MTIVSLHPGMSNWMLMVEGWNLMQSRKWICKSCTILRCFHLGWQVIRLELHGMFDMLATSMAMVKDPVFTLK